MTTSPRDRRHELTRQRILEAARAILFKEGVAGISMRTLAEQVDYSPAALYQYFASKEELIEALRQEAWQMMAAFETTPPPAATTSLADLFVHAGRDYIRFATAHPEYYQLIMSTTETGPESLEAFKQSPSFIEFMHFVETAVASGEFELPPGYAPVHLALLAWFIVHALSLLKLTMMNKCQDEFEALGVEVLEMVKVLLVKK